MDNRTLMAIFSSSFFRSDAYYWNWSVFKWSLNQLTFYTQAELCERLLINHSVSPIFHSRCTMIQIKSNQNSNSLNTRVKIENECHIWGFPSDLGLILKGQTRGPLSNIDSTNVEKSEQELTCKRCLNWHFGACWPLIAELIHEN